MKIFISFAGSAGLSGFPDFPPAYARQLEAEFSGIRVTLLQDPKQRREELSDTDVLFTLRFQSRRTLRLQKGSNGFTCPPPGLPMCFFLSWSKVRFW